MTWNWTILISASYIVYRSSLAISVDWMWFYSLYLLNGLARERERERLAAGGLEKVRLVSPAWIPPS